MKREYLDYIKYIRERKSWSFIETALDNRLYMLELIVTQLLEEKEDKQEK